MKVVLSLVLLSVVAPSLMRASDDLQHRSRYTLRSGDILGLQYRYTPEFNQTVTVLPDGYINLQIVGDVRVSDLTVEQAHDLIVEKARAYLKDPELTVVLLDFQQPYVVVAGEVGKPGKIDYREKTTAMQAILLSGGFAEDARPSQVVLFRRINSDTAEVRVLNLKKVRKAVELEHDIQLEPGDMLLVPRDKLEGISRYMKILNVGTYFNPLQFAP
jgi:polysaccharide export outer membrane protein